MYLDDTYNIESSLLCNVKNIRAIWNYNPYTFISFLTISFNRTYFELEVFSYHLFNLIIHLISALCVFWLINSLLNTPKAVNLISRHKNHKIFNYIPLFTALLFVCHPVQTEAVTYIIQRTTSLTTMLYLLSICFYLKSRLTSIGKLAGTYYIGSLFVCLLAMYSKPIAITLPLMILLIEFSFFGSSKILLKRRLLYLAPLLLCLFVIPVTLFFARDINIHQIGDLARETKNVSRRIYLFTQFNVIVTYIRLLLLPINQNLEYDYPLAKSILTFPTFFSFIFLISLFSLALRYFRRNCLISFGIFWFFLALSVESSIFPIRDVIFEHRVYLPSVGFFLVLSTLILIEAPKLKRKYLLYLLSILILCYAATTYKRNVLWGNSIKFYEDAVRKSPNKARAHDSLGNSYSAAGMKEKAIASRKKAIEISPYYAHAYYNLANTYRDIGKEEEAIAAYKKAIDIEPNLANAYNNLGNAYSDIGKKEEAIASYKKALQINPYDAEAYNNLGIAYNDIGKGEEAITSYKKAIGINPNFAEAYNNLGSVYSSLGKKQEAIDLFKRAIEINQNYIGAYNNLGAAYNAIGKRQEAIALFEEAIKIEPNNADTYLKLGLVYHAIGNSNEAIALYKKSLDINPDFAVAHNNLAVLYYRKKDYNLAIKHCDKAIELGHKVHPEFLVALKPYRK